MTKYNIIVHWISKEIELMSHLQNITFLREDGNNWQFNTIGLTIIAVFILSV